jgi:hypothetical protein
MASVKPSYLGLLNALAVGETAAEHYLLAWADTTKDKRLAKTLRFVAMREGEHGKAFAKRMLELGYEVRWPETSDRADKSMTLATSAKTDVAKFRAFKLHKAPGKTDIFDTMFMDKTIDPITGGLLGRYIAEERDSGRRLAAEYDRLLAKQKAKAA